MQLLQNEDLKIEIKQFCCQLWSLPEVSLFMPCSNPCSLLRKNIALLKTTQYWVGEKTDGIRMFLLMGVYEDVTGNELTYSVLINRAFQIFTIVMEAPDEFYTGSLFDGELVTKDDGEQIYVAFDTIVSTGFSMTHCLQSQRIQIARIAFDTFQFTAPRIKTVVKQWHSIQNAATVYERAEHCDGLIFIPENGPLVNGTQHDTFKWKQAEKHTIDFIINATGTLYLMERGMANDAYASLGIMLNPLDAIKSFIPTHGSQIVECECVKHGEESWIATPIRVREDKERANSVAVARFTLQNICENVQLTEILQVV